MFACRGVSLRVASELADIYHTLGEAENAYLWITKVLKLSRDMQRSANEIGRVLMMAIEFAVRSKISTKQIASLYGELNVLLDQLPHTTASVLNAVRLIGLMAVE